MNGKEQPTNLEMMIVTNNVEETSKATRAIFPYKLPAISLTDSVLIIPTDISNINQPNENAQTIKAMIVATRNSFQMTLP